MRREWKGGRKMKKRGFVTNSSLNTQRLNLLK